MRSWYRQGMVRIYIVWLISREEAPKVGIPCKEVPKVGRVVLALVLNVAVEVVVELH